MNTTAPESDQSTTATPQNAANGPLSEPDHPPLYRPVEDRMLAGVASGMARYLGIDVLLVRIVLVVLCFVGGIGLPLYLASWLLIPEEGASQSIAADFIRSIQGWRD